MKLVRKGLNFIIASFALVLLSVLIMFITGFIPFESGTPAEAAIGVVMLIVVPAIAIVGSVLELVGFGYAKFGGNKRFGMAFWISIAVIAADLVTIIINGIISANPSVINPDVIKGVNVAISIISAGAGIAVALFSTGGCAEAVPEMKNRAHVAMGFMIAGYALTLVVNLAKPFAAKGSLDAVDAIASIVMLVGFILYIILVFKIRNRLPKEK